MRTARFSDIREKRGESTPPVGRPPWMQTPLRQTPSPVNRMKDPSENITLPQTSFVGGKDAGSNRDNVRGSRQKSGSRNLAGWSGGKSTTDFCDISFITPPPRPNHQVFMYQ